MNSIPKESENLTAIIVDDESINRAVLDKLLKQLGYTTLLAKNGKEAVETFKMVTPHLILMDVMMPEMDGYEATRQIKALAPDKFIPIIFLTALSRADELKQCIDAGGDDFLSKPFEITVLKAKIASLERTRKLHQSMSQLNAKLSYDENLARNIFNNAIFKNNEEISEIKSWFVNSNEFNNDLLLTSYTPSHGLNVLFGNFNVKGTAAAVGALPTSEVFRSMTHKGHRLPDIAEAINQKLFDLLGGEIQLEAIFLNFNNEVNLLSVISFGMPHTYILSHSDKTLKQLGNSNETFLGKQKQLNSEASCFKLIIRNTNRILISKSDLIGSHTTAVISDENFQKTIQATPVSDSLVETVKSLFVDKINSVVDNQLSLVEIPCITSITPKITLNEHQTQNKISNDFSKLSEKNAIVFEYSIKNQFLRKADPIPSLLNFLSSVCDIENQQDSLFTIFTELYTNALDHGILNLDSDLKSSPEGFYNYFMEKESRLNSLKSGEIHISLVLLEENNLQKLKITFTDSGNGFNYQKILDEQFKASNDYSGRGYLLLKSLCDNIEFKPPGNTVSTIFSWENATSQQQ